MESFWTIWKVSNSVKSFWTVWKISGQSWKLSNSLESFLTVWKISVQSGKFPDSLESFWTVWKVSRQCEKLYTMVCMACMQKRFMYFLHIYVAKTNYALLAHFCCKNNLRALSGKFLRVKFCQPESFDFLCLGANVAVQSGQSIEIKKIVY